MIEPTSNDVWLTETFRQYELPLMGYVTHLLGDADRASDVVQDAFVRLCNQPRSDVIDCVQAWLYRVCRNRALDILKKEKRMKTLDDVTASKAEGRETAPEATMQNRESYQAANRLIAELPSNQQEVIRLKVQGGFSYREISELTGLSVSNVGYLLSTGLKHVRQRMAAIE